ncbi:ABC transporter permease [Microbacterium sp. ZW T5_56]|uniref:ABC transporter permease n=1 Tax=Microbacterium sp. ZW T5_56 TaxID=3378081 RepID=UPI0038550947
MIRRAALGVSGGVLLLWAAATASFLLMRVIPGDPVAVMLGPQANVSEDVKQRLQEQLGLDRPVLQQYADYLGGLLRGDFGESFQLRLPVTEVIGRQLGATLQLTLAALAIALALVLVVAIVARTRRARALAATIEQVVLGMPVFWIGLILLSVFAFGLGWLPVSGSRPGSLVLPAVTLALPTAALLGQLLRDGLEQAERSNFAETVRARGAGDIRLLAHHNLRHATVGVLPMLAYLIGSLLGGAVLVETVFARPGLGRVTLAAITDRDAPVLSGVLLLSCAVFVVVSLLSDLAIPLLDPRRRARVAASVPDGEESA